MADYSSWEPDKTAGSIPWEVLEACMIGVFICKGYDENDARALAERAKRPHPDSGVKQVLIEVSSVIATLHAHGYKREQH